MYSQLRCLTLRTVREAMRRLRPIVLSGPSGGGKSTIYEMARARHPDAFAFSVSHTTRHPRANEVDGTHYHFTDRDTMQTMIANGEFLEHADFGGNTYGTSKKAVEAVQSTGKICVLDLELQGVRNIKASHLDAKYVLIRAPSIALLRERLMQRGTETKESIDRRLKHAQDDLDAGAKGDGGIFAREPHLFDHVIVNDVLDVAYQQFIDAIADELNAFYAQSTTENHH